MASGDDASLAVETLLEAASTPKETPAQLRSRRHAVSTATDAPETVAEHLETVWEIYFAEIERPLSVADEFAQIDDYSTDIREACAEIFVQVAETAGERFSGHLSNLLDALRAEDVESIRELLVETVGHLNEQRVIPSEKYEEFVDLLGEIGESTESTATGKAVVNALGTYAHPAFDETVHRHAATALESIAEQQSVHLRIYSLAELGAIGVRNGYEDISLTAVEGLTAIIVEPILTDEIEDDEPVQHVRDVLLMAIEMADWDAVKSTYLLETALDADPVMETELMEPLLESGLDLDDEDRLRELVELVIGAAFDPRSVFRFSALTELKTLGVETSSTAVRRDILQSLDEVIQETSNFHLRMVASQHIGSIGECIDDGSLRRDTVAMLEQRLNPDEYLLRSAAADSLGSVAGSGTSFPLLNRVLNMLQAEFSASEREPLHSARAPIIEIGARTNDPEVQATVLGVVQSIAGMDDAGAVEILRDFPQLLEELDDSLAPEAVDVIRTAVYNDHNLTSIAGMNAISGAWLASQSDETQESIRRTVFYAGLHGDAAALTKLKVIQTCLDFAEEDGDAELLLPILGYLGGSDNELVRIFAMGSLASLHTERAVEILRSFLPDNESAVTVGVAWGRGDLQIDPPSAETDHEDVMQAMTIAAASEDEMAEQVVLSDLRFRSDANMVHSPDDDLDIVVSHILTSGALQFRRETLDLLRDHADGFRTSLRRRLVETMRLGLRDEDSTVGNATAETIARLCVTTDDRQTWERGIDLLQNGLSADQDVVTSGVAEALAEMVTSAPADAPLQQLREALYTAIATDERRVAIAAIKGLTEIGAGTDSTRLDIPSNPVYRSTLEEASRHRDISERELSVAIDLLADVEAATAVSAPSGDESDT